MPLNEFTNDQQSGASKVNKTPSPVTTSSADHSIAPLARMNYGQNCLPSVKRSGEVQQRQQRQQEGEDECERARTHSTNPIRNIEALLLSTKPKPQSTSLANEATAVTIALMPSYTTTMMNGCDKMAKTMGPMERLNSLSCHRRTDCRDGDVDKRKGAVTVARNQLLSVPLQQRKRKAVVYSRDYLGGAIHIEQVAEEEESEHVDSASETRVDRLVRMYSTLASKTDDDHGEHGEQSERGGGGTTTDSNANRDVNRSRKLSTNSDVQIDCAAESNECCSSEVVSAMRGKLCDRDARHMASHSPVSDEGCAPNLSPYSSSSEGEDEDGATPKDVRNAAGLKPHEKVERSSSSDSALGMDEDILSAAEVPPVSAIRRMTLTVADIPLRPALMPVAEPNLLPDSSTATTPSQPCECNSSTPCGVVPSKMILEARIVELPPPPPPVFSNHPNSFYRRFSTNTDYPSSRRESSQSYFSDFGGMSGDEAIGRSRYVRTPSVVVSDYSDDTTCGITLEELEFFRRQRKGSIQDNERVDDSDMSAASSCSNLNYCGSTISALDAAEIMQSLSGMNTPERKSSNCSTCSNVSGAGDDDDEAFTNQLSEALGREKKKVGENARN